MCRSLSAPLAEFLKLQFSLDLLLVFGRIVVEAFALGALKFY